MTAAAMLAIAAATTENWMKALNCILRNQIGQQGQRVVGGGEDRRTYLTRVQMLRLVLVAETVANLALIYVVRTSIPTIWGGCSGLTLFSRKFLQDVKGIFFTRL